MAITTKSCPICNEPFKMEIGVAGDNSFCATGTCHNCNHNLSIHDKEWFVKVTEFDSWPLLEVSWINNPERICQLAGVPADTFKTKIEIEAAIALRSSWSLSYIPFPDEIIFGEVTEEACWWHGKYRNILVQMPDGVLIEGNTGNQGEQEEDCSWLVHKWMREYYPNIIILNEFLEEEGILSLNDLNNLEGE